MRITDLARLLLFFVLGALALRSTVWWALAAPPIVAGWLPRAASETEVRSFGRIEARRAVPVLLLSLALLVGAFSLRLGIDPETGAPRRLRADAPQVLVEATRRALPAGSRLVVFQPYASWFEYSLPGYPVLVDSRIELFPDDVWRDYDTVVLAADDWTELLNEYEVDGLVLPGPDNVGRKNDGWCVEEAFAVGTLYVPGQCVGDPAST